LDFWLAIVRTRIMRMSGGLQLSGWAFHRRCIRSGRPEPVGLGWPGRSVLGTAGATVVAVAVVVAGCGASHPVGVTLPADDQPLPAGRGPAYRLRPISPAVARRAPILGLTCARTHRRYYGVHLELYAHRLVLPVPAGIGIAPPQRRRGVYVLGGACSYPVRTFEPTGVVVVDVRPPMDLAMLFAVWGQPLSRRALGSFRGPVRAFVGGRRWRGAPGSISLARHAEIVLEIAGAVPPHPRYRFAPGL